MVRVCALRPAEKVVGGLQLSDREVNGRRIGLGSEQMGRVRGSSVRRWSSERYACTRVASPGGDGTILRDLRDFDVVATHRPFSRSLVRRACASHRTVDAPVRARRPGSKGKVANF